MIPPKQWKNQVLPKLRVLRDHRSLGFSIEKPWDFPQKPSMVGYPHFPSWKPPKKLAGKWTNMDNVNYWIMCSYAFSMVFPVKHLPGNRASMARSGAGGTVVATSETPSAAAAAAGSAPPRPKRRGGNGEPYALDVLRNGKQHGGIDMFDILYKFWCGVCWFYIYIHIATTTIIVVMFIVFTIIYGYICIYIYQSIMFNNDQMLVYIYIYINWLLNVFLMVSTSYLVVFTGW